MTILDIELSYYVVCGIAALVLFFRLQNVGQPVIEIVKYVNPKWGDSTGGRIVDALLFASFGAVIGTLVTQPTNPQQAVAAGLGWTGLLSKLNG
ncbi:MAG: hypothetical protein SWQ30_10380 [Thermodesulfobacteriota bacterium]|nr:hypothetical protein [Thermodesulfobacteriota bacterium]